MSEFSAMQCADNVLKSTFSRGIGSKFLEILPIGSRESMKDTDIGRRLSVVLRIQSLWYPAAFTTAAEP